MKEITRVAQEKCYDKASKAAEVMAAIAAIDEADKVLNVLEERVAPYGYYIPMKEIIDNAREWDKYTATSRRVLVAELNGCIDVVNHRIRLYREKDVTIKMLVGKNKGKIKTVKESTAKDFIDCGDAVLV